jgi:predicted MPP superfamily phosphohydrolase
VNLVGVDYRRPQPYLESVADLVKLDSFNLLGTNLNIADLHTPYTKGLYTLPTAIYVNSGLGAIGPPVRLGAPPEITLLRLRCG